MQKISELETPGSTSSTSEMEEIGRTGRRTAATATTSQHSSNLRILGTTTSSSTTDHNGIFESSNTLSEYLNANDIYDSLKGRLVVSSCKQPDNTFFASSDQPPTFSNQPRSRQTSFLAAASLGGGLDTEYPTYKLDRNTVVDTSMKWERYGYPITTSGGERGLLPPLKHKSQQQQQVAPRGTHF
jgi:hypothetical protein